MPAAEFAFTPTGAELVFFGYNRAYHLYDVTTDRVTREVPTDTSVHNVSYSPDGKALDTAEWLAGARLRDPSTGGVRDTLTPDGRLGVFAVAFQPDARLAAHCWRADGGAGGTMREQLAVWDLAAVGVPVEVDGPEGVEVRDFHALRNGYISYVLRSGADLKQAMTPARHSDPRLTTARYARTGCMTWGQW